MANIHTRARKSPYAGTKDVHVRCSQIKIQTEIKFINNQRTSVPDEKVPWNVNWPDYKPPDYTAKKVLKNPPWADDPDAYD